MKRALSAVFLVAIASLAMADKWCFVVAGDGRTDDNAPDPTGINMAIAPKLFQAMNAEHPRFMLWTGDLVHGVYGKVKTPIEQQFTAWKQNASVLQNVALLPVRGNHETRGDADGKIWMKSIKPLIGIGGKVDYLKGEEGFSYSFVPKNDPQMTVIALDQYINAHRVNLVELEKALKKAKDGGAKNIFVFAHEMAFTCTAHGDDDNLSKFTADRDKFLELLEMYGVRYFFAGHDHVYDWMVIKHPKWNPNYALNQIVAGTSGAPFYPDKGYFGDHGTYELVRKEHKDSTYGYLLVEVDDASNVTVTFKTVTP